MLKKIHLTAGIAAGLFASSAFAMPITGTLQAGGGLLGVKGTGTSVGSCIDFYNISPGCGTPGMFTVENSPVDPLGGIFDGAAGTTTNLIKDLTPGIEPLTAFLSIPSINVFFDLPALTLNAVTTGNCTSTAVNDVCSPINSPFTLINSNTVDPTTGQADSVTVKLNLNLIGYKNSLADGSTAYFGGFSTTITGPLLGVQDANIASVLAAIMASQTISGASWQATISPTAAAMTPESGSWFMFITGVGLMSVSWFARRDRTQRRRQ
jgi:hypothetical protein